MADSNGGTASRRQIILIGMATFGGAILLFLLWYFLLRMPLVPAFTGINSTDALTITQELGRLKTPYELADDGTTILVPQDKVNAARVSILGGELPLKGAVGFELFNKTDMGLTEFAQKINYQRALQGELARTIMSLDDIETARVHLSLPEEGIFEQDRRPAKASITLATKIGGTINGNAVRGIQQLVAAAVPDLQAANVAILDARGQLLSPEVTEPDQRAETPDQQKREALEKALAGTVKAAIQDAGISIPLTVKVAAFGDFSSAPSETANAAGQEADNIPVAGIVRRANPVKVQLQLTAMPGRSIQEKLLSAAREAIDYDAALGDIVAIQINPMISDWTAIQDTETTVRKGAARQPENSIFESIPIWPILVAFGLLILSFAVWIYTGLRNKTMSIPEKQAFAERLKSLLEEDGHNGRTAI
jgi:flagellar M-ring protein FliF